MAVAARKGADRRDPLVSEPEAADVCERVAWRAGPTWQREQGGKRRARASGLNGPKGQERGYHTWILRGQTRVRNQMCARIKPHTYDDTWYRNECHIINI
jgi:hypothetical protein